MHDPKRNTVNLVSHDNNNVKVYSPNNQAAFNGNINSSTFNNLNIQREYQQTYQYPSIPSNDYSLQPGKTHGQSSHPCLIYKNLQVPSNAFYQPNSMQSNAQIHLAPGMQSQAPSLVKKQGSYG